MINLAADNIEQWHQELRRAGDHETLAATASEFLARVFDATASLTDAETPARPADEPRVADEAAWWPLSSGKGLLVTRQTPFSQVEQNWLLLGAALVSALAGRLEAAVVNHRRHQLLARFGSAVAGETALPQLFTLLDERLPEAFPGLGLRVLLLDAADKRLHLAQSIGTDPGEVNADRLLPELLETGAPLLPDQEPSQVVVPIIMGQNVEGALVAGYGHPPRPGPDDIAALQVLANHIGAALSYGRLKQRLGRQSNQLETIHAITERARSLKPLEPTLAEVHERIVEAFHATSSIIALYDRGTHLVTFPSCIHAGRRAQRAPVAIQDEASLTAWVIRQGEPYATGDWTTASTPVAGRFLQPQPRSIMCFPLHVQDEVVGAIHVASDRPEAYTESDYYLLAALAGHVAVIVWNARLHDATQQQLAELTTLYEAGASMTAELAQAAVQENVVAAMLQALQADSCILLMWDGNLRRLRVRAQRANNAWLAPGQQAYLAENPIMQRLFEEQRTQVIGPGDLGDPDARELLATGEFVSLLLVPLQWHQQKLGLLALGQTGQARTYGENEMRLIRNLTNQAAVSLEHARLFTQAEKRLEELSTFQQIALQITSRLDLDVVLETISESALKLLDINNLHIYLYDADNEVFEVGMALWRDGRRTPAVSLPRANGLTASVARAGEPIVINDAANHPLYQTQESAQWGVAAIAGFPLKRQDRVIGVFTVTFLKAHSFGDDELLMLKLLADQAAVAVQNARLFNELQYQLQVMSAVVDLAKQVTGDLNVQSVMDTTVDVLQALLEARACTITMLDEDALVVEAAAGTRPEFLKVRIPLGEGASGRAVTERRSIYIRDASLEPDFRFFDTSIRSLLAVPLTSRDEVFGTVTVDHTEKDAFDESDIQFLTIAAAQVSIAIANARLYEEVQNRATQLALALEELKENDRLKDELVQNVSHELRTPLTFVKGYVDLLMAGDMGTLNDHQHEALEIVSSRTDVITRLIDDIVTLQRIESDNLVREPLDISHFLAEAVAGHQLTATRHGLELHYLAPESRPVIVVDQARINQVVDNLIGNAMKFSPDGGQIEVELQDRAEEVVVMVTDQGIGVAQDKLERIFDRFYQVDGSSIRRFGGTGIGLAIVKRIIEAHNGRVWVESEYQKGSSFFFALPKSTVPARLETG